MSYEYGRAAIFMEKTDKVPRTEYSAHNHWGLVKEVTGIDTDILENRPNASKEFIKAWDYSLFWNTWIHRQYLKNGRITDMGHAVYMESSKGESDFSKSVTQPFKDVDEAINLNCVKEYGIFEKVELKLQLAEHNMKMKSIAPNVYPMAGTYISIFSGLIEIFGWEILLEAMYEDEFKYVVESYYNWVKQFLEVLAESDLEMICTHDDICWTSGPVNHPQWYRETIFPYYKKLWEPLKEANKKIIFNSDGNWTMFFDDIIEAGADAVVMEPCSDMSVFAEKHGDKHAFVGGIDTRTLLMGTKEEIESEVKYVINKYKDYPGFVLAVGNHIPPNTPVENAIWYNEMYEKYGRR